MAFRCADCDSNDLTKTAVVYEQGVFHSFGYSSATTIGRNGAPLGVSVDGVAAVSGIARRAAPPVRYPAPVSAYLFIACLGLEGAYGLVRNGAGLLFGWPNLWLGSRLGMVDVPSWWLTWLLFSAIAVYFGLYRPVLEIRRRWEYNRNDFPGLRAAWERSYFCSRCGRIGDPIHG